MIDPKKIRKVYAKAPELVRFGRRDFSVLTQELIDLDVDQSLLIETEGGNDHKIQQRSVNARVNLIKKTYPEREYVTRTLREGEVLHTFTAKGAKAGVDKIRTVTLGIFRTK